MGPFSATPKGFGTNHTVSERAKIGQPGWDNASRQVPKKVGGEKQLAPTAEARARIFTLALDADEEYRGKLARRDEIQAKLEQAKVEAGYLRDRLNILLAAMRSHETEDG